MNLAYRISLQGHVQGCGVRPAIVRLANRLGVMGWVENASDRVLVHVQGDANRVERFRDSLVNALPRLAWVQAQSCQSVTLLADLKTFVIAQREAERSIVAGIPEIPPDRAICKDCERELFDPHSRRYLWPFIGCCACGPRFAWLKQLPFLRENTTFARFCACDTCRAEYGDAEARRFGMELIACEQCGPTLYFRDANGLSHGNTVWREAVQVLREGGIVAVQAFSGFHLLALADDDTAITRLRAFKSRKAKPLALMAPSLSWVEEFLCLSEEERGWLEGPHRPIVLLRKKDKSAFQWVAPSNPWLGVMLPANGIQHLILAELGVPVVATSANRRGDPVAAQIDEVLPWLGQGLDAICYHNVPTWQAQDDSVLSVLSDGALCLRRARGFAHEHLPLSSTAGDAGRQPLCGGQSATDVMKPVLNSGILAEGAFLKNTFAVSDGYRAWVSQYLGDLDSVAVAERKALTESRALRLCGITPDLRLIDAHPESAPTNVVAGSIRVLHHHAHVAALVAESGRDDPMLVAAWDGIGYAGGATWWGSEVFSLKDALPQALAGLQPFYLPGGDACSREPWRVMVALLLAAGVERDQVLQFLQKSGSQLTASPAVQRLVIDSIVSELQAGKTTKKITALPLCTSMGRFLEGLSALLLGPRDSHFEAQLACELEYAADEGLPSGVESVALALLPDGEGVLRWQWQTLVKALWEEVQGNADRCLVARRVLHTVAEALLTLCREMNLKTLGVSGGCFQNRYLLEYLLQRCAESGMTLVRPRRLPPNDGAISYGQLQLLGPMREQR